MLTKAVVSMHRTSMKHTKSKAYLSEGTNTNKKSTTPEPLPYSPELCLAHILVTLEKNTENGHIMVKIKMKATTSKGETDTVFFKSS